MSALINAENMTVSIPSTKPCEKDCPYCVSKMTPQVKSNYDLMYRNLPTVISIMERGLKRSYFQRLLMRTF